MTRGYFDQLASNPAYAESHKDWYVSLQQSNCYWYELIVNPPDFADTKDGISSQLEELRLAVEQTLEKRFIYFFASRTKVRFDTDHPPKYTLWGKYLVITLLVGRHRKRHVVKRRIFNPDHQQITPRVEVSERFIRIYSNDTSSETYSVHDFLQINDIALGIPTQVHYVGITKDPASRPLSRKHRGITDTLYNVSNDDNDFFIFVNLFKVLSNAKNNAYKLNFVVANSMIDEIPTDEEGLIIESALIAYFDCASQHLNREKERTVLSNRLASLSGEHNIHSVSVHLEMENPSEYFIFGSETSPPALGHSFLYRIVNGLVELKRFASAEELHSHLNEAI